MAYNSINIPGYSTWNPTLGDYTNPLGQDLGTQQMYAIGNQYTPLNNIAPSNLSYGQTTYGPAMNSTAPDINWLGDGKNPGVLIPGLNALSGLANAYLGFKQYGLSKDAFNFNKDLARTNLANQAQTYNTALEDRKRAALLQTGVSNPSQLANELSRYTSSRKVSGTV